MDISIRLAVVVFLVNALVVFVLMLRIVAVDPKDRPPLPELSFTNPMTKEEAASIVRKAAENMGVEATEIHIHHNGRRRYYHHRYNFILFFKHPKGFPLSTSGEIRHTDDTLIWHKSPKEYLNEEWLNSDSNLKGI